MIKLRLFSKFGSFRLAAILILANVAAGTETIDIYQAEVSAPDRSEAGMGVAFQSAMKTVLVRVTGRRAAGQEAVFAPLLINARRYIQQYRVAGGHQIWVAFDAIAIERWLTANGQPLWGRERPATYMWVGVPTVGGGGNILTRDDQSEIKRGLDQVAAARGIPVIWPSAADVQRNDVVYATLAKLTPDGTLADAAKRAGADGMLIGRASDGGANPNIRWLFSYQGRSNEFSGTQEGINHAADMYASLFAANGESAVLDVEISGVADLQSYAEVQSYMESLTLISRVSVVGFDNDTLKLRLAARGGAQSLQRAIALDSRLEPISGSESATLRFRTRR